MNKSLLLFTLLLLLCANIYLLFRLINNNRNEGFQSLGIIDNPIKIDGNLVLGPNQPIEQYKSNALYIDGKLVIGKENGKSPKLIINNRDFTEDKLSKLLENSMPYYKTKLDKTLESDKLTDEEKRNLISNRDKDSDKNKELCFTFGNSEKDKNDICINSEHLEILNGSKLFKIYHNNDAEYKSKGDYGDNEIDISLYKIVNSKMQLEDFLK